MTFCRLSSVTVLSKSSLLLPPILFQGGSGTPGGPGEQGRDGPNGGNGDPGPAGQPGTPGAFVSPFGLYTTGKFLM